MKVEIKVYGNEEITSNTKCKLIEVHEGEYPEDDVYIYECEMDNIADIETITKKLTYSHGVSYWKAIDGFKFKEGNETKFHINTWINIAP